MVFETPFGLFVSIMFFTWVVMGKVRISCWFHCCGCSCCCCRRRCGCCCCSFLLWEMDGNLNISEFLLLIVKLTLVWEKFLLPKFCNNYVCNSSYFTRKEAIVGNTEFEAALITYGCIDVTSMHMKYD